MSLILPSVAQLLTFGFHVASKKFCSPCRKLSPVLSDEVIKKKFLDAFDGIVKDIFADETLKEIPEEMINYTKKVCITLFKCWRK